MHSMFALLNSSNRSTLPVILRIWTRLNLTPKASSVTLVVFQVDVSSQYHPLTSSIGHMERRQIQVVQF